MSRDGEGLSLLPSGRPPAIVEEPSDKESTSKDAIVSIFKILRLFVCLF